MNTILLEFLGEHQASNNFNEIRNLHADSFRILLEILYNSTKARIIMQWLETTKDNGLCYCNRHDLFQLLNADLLPYGSEILAADTPD